MTTATITISWEGLTERGQAILRFVGIPASEGFTELEIARGLGTTKRSVCDLLSELREELRGLG